jgi:hypothetical protein
MKQPRALSFAVCIGFMLIAGLWVAPAKLTAASTTSSIVGTWEGTVDPGAQAKKTVVLHISVGQDGIISGTIDYPDQDTSGIEITAITYQQHALHMESTPGPEATAIKMRAPVPSQNMAKARSLPAPIRFNDL